MPDTKISLENISDGQNFLHFNPNGGLIESLQLEGVKILASIKRGDGKTACTHFCIPMLGPDIRILPKGTTKLPQHGPSRNEIWQIINHDSQRGLITVKYELKHQSYPQGLVVIVDHQLKDGLYKNTTTIKNQGTEKMPIVPGWHLYWNKQNTSSIILNGKNISKEINPGSSFIDLSEKNIIKVSGMYEVELTQTNLPRAVLWSGQDNQGKQDQNYFCLEPIAADLNTFGKPESILAQGEQKKFIFSIKLIKS